MTAQTGGVTVTLGLTYLALAAHERNRRTQANALRAQAGVLDSLSGSPSSISASTGRYAAAATTDVAAARYRATGPSHFADVVKDRWNAEIEGAVHWAQTTDWVAVRETAEARLFGLARDAGVEEAAREAGRRAAGVADQVREDVAGAVAKGVEKAMAAVQRVEERGAAMLVPAAVAGGSDDAVRKALSQRYRRDDDVMRKSVTEILAERYTPIDKRDNTQLRGL